MPESPIEAVKTIKKEYLPWRFIPLLILHLSCGLVYFAGFSWVAFGVAFFAYALRMFAVTGFLHRYFAHRSFKTGRITQFVFAFIATASCQRGPLWWAANHRDHHKYSDTPNDTHSPYQLSFFDSHIGWVYWKENLETKHHNIKDFSKYKELVWLDKYDLIPAALYIVFLYFLGLGLQTYYPGLETGPFQMIVWGFCISTVFLLHMVLSVNTICHLFGKQKFKTTDYSRNNWLMAIFTLGEGWHNNHHRFPNSMRQGFLWYEYDITGYIIRFFALIGLVTDIKPIPPNIIEEAKTAKYTVPLSSKQPLV